jgi:hypothetical protein
VTDLEKLTTLLGEWGVPFTVEPPRKDAAQVIEVRNFAFDDHPKVTGYSEFFTIFEFDAEGTFLRMGAWE